MVNKVTIQGDTTFGYQGVGTAIYKARQDAEALRKNFAASRLCEKYLKRI